MPSEGEDPLKGGKKNPHRLRLGGRSKNHSSKSVTLTLRSQYTKQREGGTTSRGETRVILKKEEKGERKRGTEKTKTEKAKRGTRE